MVRRQQIQDLEAAQLSPQARPVDVFASPNRGALDLVQDFAGLSSTIQDFLAAKAERDKQKQLAEGRAYAAENPQLAQQLQAGAVEDPKANRKAFRKLVEDQKIKQLQSPWARVGYYEAAARQLVTSYQAAVSARLEETAQVIGPDGQPQEPVSIEQVMQEEYAKIADNPILQNTYGRDAAVGLREQFDAKARLAAAELKLDAEDKAYRSDLTKETAEKFDEITMSDGEAVPGLLQGLTDHVRQAMTEKTVKDPRGLVIDALRLSVARTRRGEGGAEQALLMLEDVEHLKVEGLALNEDPQASAAIEQLRDELIAQQDRDERRAAEKPDLELKAAIDAREGEWVTKFTETLDSGASYAAAVAEEEARVKAEVTDPKLRGNVLQAMRATARKVEESQITTPGLMNDFGALVASGDVAAARAFRDAALADPSVAILPKDLASINAELAQAESLTPLVEGFAPWKEVQERFKEKENEFSQYASDVDAEWRVRVRAERESFNLAYQAFAASVRGQPNAEQQLRDFISQHEAESAKEVSSFRENQTAKRQTFLDKLREFDDKGQDARELIERAFARGELGSQEKEHYLLQNEKATDRDVLYRRAAVQDAESRLYNQVLREGLEEGFDPVQADYDRASDAVFQFRRQLDLWIDTNRPTTDPRQFPRSLDGAVPEILDQLRGTTPEAEAAEEALEAGKTAVEAKEASTKLGTARAKRDAWALHLSAPTQLKGDEPILGRHPKVAREIYADYGRFVDREPSRIRQKHEVQDRFTSEVIRLTKAGDPDADKAAASMFKLIGIPAQALLDGKMTVQRSPQFGQLSESARFARQAEKLKRSGFSSMSVGFSTVSVDEVLARHRTLVGETAEFKVAPEDVDAYATPLWENVQAMRNFRDQRPEDMERLRVMLGIPDDPVAVRDWLQAQTDAMQRNRSNPIILTR